VFQTWSGRQRLHGQPRHGAPRGGAERSGRMCWNTTTPPSKMPPVRAAWGKRGSSLEATIIEQVGESLSADTIRPADAILTLPADVVAVKRCRLGGDLAHPSGIRLPRLRLCIGGSHERSRPKSIDEGGDAMIWSTLSKARATSAHGPRLPTWALQQVGSYLGYTGRQINVVVTAASDPTRSSASGFCCDAASVDGVTKSQITRRTPIPSFGIV
jgi:hypothetical protein